MRKLYVLILGHLLVLPALLFPICSLAANITVKTDRDPVAINESFQLIFEADGSVDDDPEFAPLDRDFKIVSTSVSSNMSIINSSISSTKQWQLTVLARRTGRLTIPPIHFGKDRSPATTITVAKTSTGSTIQRRDDEIFLQVNAIPEHPYVQSQLRYTIKLFRAVNTANASLSDPEVSGGDAVIEKLDEDKSYEIRIKGKRYLVVERNFAIYPQVSGKVTIAPIRFQGQMAANSSSLFDPFGPQPKTIIRQSEPLTINVSPIPDDYAGGHWLPAQNVTLEEQWSEDPPVFKVGEPITRTLILTAKGQTSSQLPVLPGWQLPSFKLYPDQPELGDSKTRAGITGIRQEKVAIIPNRPGDFLLPEISIPWWNTETNRMEYAVLPEEKITVAPAITTQSSQDLLELNTPQLADRTEQSSTIYPGDSDDKVTADAVYNQVTDNSTRLWQWLSAGLAISWLVTLLLWWVTRKRKPAVVSDDTGTTNIKQSRYELKQACSNNDATKAKQALLCWGKYYWPDSPPMSIGEIGKRSSDNLANEILSLSNALYSSHQGVWQGKILWEVFNKEYKEKPKNSRQETGKLEPLFRI